ncbi:DUF3078 domain-containing protein [Halpernia frigidisoli]|uniref:DUF3078 domain-containing protein n=1 Tax=Halpernia frigidisoli TaxID=1125876 RepID=A0A1I3HGU4_9FLAO|nr:DUF3078 domain-containing protein [Halpernia frigidisoli]SFI34924.1 Protein of unknown function [Halpernia frigidisoli]
MKWILAFTVFFGLLKAQQTPYLKTIDSINQLSWEKNSIQLDSLSNVKIARIFLKPVDTLAINLDLLTGRFAQEVPLTPYNLLRTKDPKRWFYFGQNTLIFNQSSFSNWNSGGNNNIGIIGKVNYQINYKKNRHFLDYNVKMGYGLVSAAGQSTRKTDDYIDLSSNYGYDLGKNYYLSTGFQFLSQFTPGYNYSATPNPTNNDKISDFLAPAYVNVGLGVSYNPKENFQIVFRPINGKFTIVGDSLLQKAGNFGLERDGQSLRSELGAMLNVQYRLNIYKDITYTNSLNLFTNYLFHSERVDIGYSGALSLKFNKFITTTVNVDLLYDHDQVQKLQIKQTLGLGVSYSFGFVDDDNIYKKRGAKPFIGL